MKTLDIKHNPHPKMRYEITLEIPDAPGSFDSVRGLMRFEVSNERCSPENPISGTYGQRPSTGVPFTFNRVSDRSYVGTVYLDLLQDEDYFGLGVCHWEATYADAEMKAGGVVFNVSIHSDEIITQTPRTEYLWRQDYLDPASVSDGIGFVIPLTDAVKQHPERYFSATLTAREDF